jgi:hypothetical protein
LLACVLGSACNVADAPDPTTDLRRLCDAAECTIELEHVATLSDSFEPGAISVSRSLWVLRDKQGRFFMPGLPLTRVLVFDSTGRFHSTIGRRGEGPGEFERVVGILTGTEGDSVYIADFLLRRLTVLAPDLNVARVQSMPRMPTLMRDDGSFILAEQIRTAERSGYPVHTLDAGGSIVQSFGIDTPQYRPDLTRLLNRVVAPARGGRVWTAAPGRYVLERWDPDSGRREARLIVPSSWFRESDRPEPDTERPSPIIVGIWEDADSLVWVLHRDADSGWQPEPLGHVPLDFDLYGKLHDWVIEVIDPVSARVLASRRFPEYLGYRAPSALLVSIREVEFSGTVLDIWRPVLQPKGGSS